MKMGRWLRLGMGGRDKLMKNREEAFAELKNYYNEITRDNTKLIKENRN